MLYSGSKYAQQEQQQQPMSHPPSGASPPYVPLPPDQSHSDEYAVPPEATYSHERDTSSHLAAAAVEPRPASPARKSIFDFVSPFDALTGAANTGAKRKPPPVQPNDEPPSWSQMSVDPKRKSVENLMDQLTRGQAPPSASSQQPVAPYDLYSPMQAEEPPAPETLQARAARPLPPQPSLPTGSPRSSPPKQASQAVRQQRRNADSPIGQPGAPQGPFGNNYNREKESSPLPQRGAVPDGRRGNGQKGKNPSPRYEYVLSRKLNNMIAKIPRSAHSQLIMFDVTQPLDEIQAPLDTVKSTAIALVKVDSTFLPGTTIGATQWVAYAMTKGT